MHFSEMTLNGAWIIDPIPAQDARGFFARTFCQHEFLKRQLETVFVQHSISGSLARGTIRGMHFQRSPHQEVKIVSCRKGAIWDVIIDLRVGSPTCCRWQGVELTADNHRQLYVPAGFAHGFQTLRDECEVHYLISAFYEPEAASGVRYDDPAFEIEWPLNPTMVSGKDRSWPDYGSGDRDAMAIGQGA
jgi:dTDP-4-dehydrorhamnose 3,5-epimerase